MNYKIKLVDDKLLIPNKLLLSSKNITIPTYKINYYFIVNISIIIILLMCGICLYNIAAENMKNTETKKIKLKNPIPQNYYN